MAYLLDTNVVISIINDPAGKPARRLKLQPPAEIAISAIVAHELYYGAYKSARVGHNLAIVDALQFQVLELDREDAQHAGDIRALLGKAGRSIGPYDVLIAGQARARGLILVTDNVSEFARIPGLVLENWLRD
jgi:tRNA(fMet)-specific endonuclease VapC